jgi:N-acetylneuraminate synthase
MCTLAEIEMALGILAFGYLKNQEKPYCQAFQEAFSSPDGHKILKEKVVLLHCTTEYPAPFKDVHLRAMRTMEIAFNLPVGYSDHTTGIAVTIAAVALGASVIEKHFTLDRQLPGPDHGASLEPQELEAMVSAVRQVEISLGTSLKTIAPSELKNRAAARKSLVVSSNIRKGDIFTENNLTVKRPGTGVSPIYYWDWIGKKAEKDYLQDEILKS